MAIATGNWYVGRFAPSPTGPLHAGSLVAALASWLDARVHGGRWLVRIEDVDATRCMPGLGHTILQQLAACGLHPDETPVWQSQRTPFYQHALDQLIASQKAYPCACSRKDIETALDSAGIPKPRNAELVYPGTCRQGLRDKAARTWRFDAGDFKINNAAAPMEYAQAATKKRATTSTSCHWVDRRLGQQTQDVVREVGDFVLKRADGLFAYQLAVVVDDGLQGITHVVRGEDLADNTARQIFLQRALGLPTPSYLHTPLVRGANGEKLSKQNGAAALDTSTPATALQALQQAAQVLGLQLWRGQLLGGTAAPSALLEMWTHEWRTQTRTAAYRPVKTA